MQKESRPDLRGRGNAAGSGQPLGRAGAARERTCSRSSHANRSSASRPGGWVQGPPCRPPNPASSTGPTNSEGPEGAHFRARHPRHLRALRRRPDSVHDFTAMFSECGARSQTKELAMIATMGPGPCGPAWTAMPPGARGWHVPPSGAWDVGAA